MPAIARAEHQHHQHQHQQQQERRAAAPPPPPPRPSRRALLAAAAALATAGPRPSPASAAPEPFLKRSGGRGFLAEEEAALVSLRNDIEGQALRELAREVAYVEREVDNSKAVSGKLCATPFGVDVVGISEAVALVGALVGGVTARNRKNEVERLNEQLRKINVSLRQQARSGTVYAPGLSYAPPPAGSAGAAAAAAAAAARGGAEFEVSGPGGARAGVLVAAPPAPSALAAGPVLDAPTVVTDASAAAAGAAAEAAAPPAAAPAAAAAAPAAPAPFSPWAPPPTGQQQQQQQQQQAGGPGAATIFSMDDDDLSSDQGQCRDALRAGKRLLKEGNGSAAMVRFEKALLLSRALADGVQQRRAVRGLAAAARLQGQHRAAIGHLERVLELSTEMGEYTGDADAYGALGDALIDLGEFERAAEMYDKYIASMG